MDIKAVVMQRVDLLCAFYSSGRPPVTLLSNQPEKPKNFISWLLHSAFVLFFVSVTYLSSV